MSSATVQSNWWAQHTEDAIEDMLCRHLEQAGGFHVAGLQQLVEPSRRDGGRNDGVYSSNGKQRHRRLSQQPCRQ